ncbi:hypothetical protein V1264_021426 [Littorina saxatilis]|uniref:Uncharacterized protein n=1 Tax=Littorina saxatilis TaxID=31220 RepID=A0AAN9FVG4_9CAEN
MIMANNTSVPPQTDNAVAQPANPSDHNMDDFDIHRAGGFSRAPAPSHYPTLSLVMDDKACRALGVCLRPVRPALDSNASGT